MPISTPYNNNNNNNNVHFNIPSNPYNHLHSLLNQIHSRRLLFHSPLYPHRLPVSVPAVSDPTPESGTILGNTFDANLVMILAVLLCALICALVLNSIVRCLLRCSNRFGLDRSDPSRFEPVGLRRKALRSLPVFVYSAGLKLPGTGSECAVCLSDLIPGERIRVLPKCSHGFHVKCIDRWLMARPSCPICRQCLFATSKKSSGCRVVNRVDPVVSILVPLEPEGLIHDYRGDAF